MKRNAWQMPGCSRRRNKLSKAGAALLLPGSLQQIQAELSDRLAWHSEAPGLEAQVLLAHVLGKPRAWIVAHPEARLEPGQAAELATFVERRLSGEPLPYILGQWEFFGLKLAVSPAVLIPRPETELLVDHALAWLNADNQKGNDRLCIADIGTGTGCIAISLAVHAPGRRIVAVDISRPALEIACFNMMHHHVQSQVQLVQGSLLDPFSKHSVDLVCANLPYIPSLTLQGLAIFGREPTLALDGGPDGLDVVRCLLVQARRVLAPGGLILIEIEAEQGVTAPPLAAAAFPQAAVSLHQDLAGKDRLVSIQT